MADARVYIPYTTQLIMGRYKLVIFDCDGTLVDSERVGNLVIVDCLKALDHTITLNEAIELFAGRKMGDTLILIEQRIGKPLPSGFLEDIRSRMASAFREGLETMPEVRGMLQTIQSAGIPCCVASNGPHEKMEVSLGVTGLLPFFGAHIFSAYDCNSWKPDAGLFQFAASRMGVSPDECAVIEDSALGVQGGIAAGMAVFGYAPNDSGSALAGLGAKVFHNMNDLPELLGCTPSNSSK